MIKLIIKKILIIFIGVPVCLVIRVVRPIRHIRIGFFYSERIGHFAKDVELYLADKTLNPRKKTSDFFFIGGSPANEFFLKLIKRKIFVNKFFSIIFLANKFFPDHNNYEILPNIVKLKGTFDLNGIIPKTKTHLTFSKEEKGIAQNFLKNIGCNKKFICLNIRDSAYLNSTFKDKDFSSHNYRDSKPNTYLKAIKHLIKNDYFVIRMGKHVNSKLQIKSPNFLDYPFSKIRNEFLDVWLMANCDFCISTANGLDEISTIFRKPILYVNALPLGHFTSWDPRTIWVPKKIVNNKDMKPLSISDLIDTESISLPKGDCDFSEILQRNNLLVIDNTEDEILDGVIEMQNMLEFNNEQNKEINHIHKIFWEKIKKWDQFESHHNVNQEYPYGIISESYLQKNQSWLIK